MMLLSHPSEKARLKEDRESEKDKIRSGKA
jgi:hypothetical protein